MAILLCLMARGILGKKCFGYLSKVVERVWRQRVKPIRGRAFQTRRKCVSHYWIIVGVDHHLILVVSNVLDQIAHSRIVIENESWEFSLEPALLYLLGEKGIENFGNLSCWVALELGLPNPLLNQRVEGMEIRRPYVLELALHLCWAILEGRKLVLELLVDLP